MGGPIGGLPKSSLESFDLDGDGVRLRVHRAGTGDPVILLHGFPDSWTTWLEQVDPLIAAGYSVLLPELRGYGSSGRPAGVGAYHMDHLVGDVVALIHSTPAGRAVVIGHDWGGAIAWAVAVRYPQLIERLVILNAPPPPLFARHLRKPRQLLRSWYILAFQLPVIPEAVLRARDYSLLRWVVRQSDSGRRHPERVDAVVADFQSPGALEAAINYYRAARKRKRSTRTPRSPVSAPTLVLWGARDPALDGALVDDLPTYFADLRLRLLPEAAHWVHFDAPGIVTGEILTFLHAEPGTPIANG